MDLNGFLHVKHWSDRMPEECGIIGAYDTQGRSVSHIVFYGLYAIQHRGQESAGIAIADGHKILHHKAMGLVTEVFQEEDEESIGALGKGYIGIGHVRYSTTGKSYIINAQPLVVQAKRGTMALAHNGNLVNADALRAMLQDLGHINQTTLDTEVIAHLLARFAKDGLVQSIQETIKYLQGSFALVMATKDHLIGLRDPYGIRPLALGKLGSTYVLASETCAFDAVGAEYVRDILPGEMVIIDEKGLRSVMLDNTRQRKLCIFEFVYFARADSLIDGVSVYTARENAGRLLAEDNPVEADIVSGVPDSAITAAIGYAERSGIPYGEGLAKNRYVGRTFIRPQQNMREQGVRIKLNALRRNVHNKRLILIDDSIVRGTTSKKIVEMLRDAGAKEVHMRISSPPVRYPCYFGIDTPTAGQLIGSNNSIEEIRRIIGADTLSYLTNEELLRSVGGDPDTFCMGCFDGNYPVDVKEACRYCPGHTGERT